MRGSWANGGSGKRDAGRDLPYETTHRGRLTQLPGVPECRLQLFSGRYDGSGGLFDRRGAAAGGFAFRDPAQRGERVRPPQRGGPQVAHALDAFGDGVDRERAWIQIVGELG